MNYRLRVIWYYIEVMFAKILIFFNIEKNILPIPKDTPYCYVWDEERNKREPIDGYWIKPCKYYRFMKGNRAACTYTGFIGWDLLLGDQCKTCGISEGLENLAD